MKSSILMIAFVAAIASGCASVETVQEAKGQGLTRTFPQAYEPVFNATLAAAITRKLEVVEADKINGHLILSNGISLRSLGERIAVFVRYVAVNRTAVEIVSKPVLSPLNFPPDWQQILFDQIEAELKAGK